MDNAMEMPDDWEAQLIDYTVGVMEPAEAAAFEVSLEECRKHVQAARHYGEIFGLLGTVVSQAEPPDGHKSRLMSRISTTPQLPSSLTMMSPGESQTPASKQIPLVSTASSRPTPTTVNDGVATLPQQRARISDLGEYRARRSSNGILVGWLAIAAAFVLLVGLWGWSANSDKQKAQDQLAALLGTPNIPAGYKVISLTAQKDYPTTNALVLYNPDKNNAVFVAGGLQQLPADKVYELWLLKPDGQGNPDKGGTFTADQTGSVTHATTGPQTIAQYAGFAVTIEPAPGVDLATGPAVALGKFSTP